VTRLAILILFAVAFAFKSASEVVAQTGDARIVEAFYQSDSVYPITIKPGHATVVEFDRDEAVESVALGDAENWLVETTASASRIVVKPGPNSAPTNMVVLTTTRTYAFTLNPFGEQETFVLRFNYSEPVPPESSYRLRGAKTLHPRKISDNGRTTTIFWDPGANFPAIFVLDDEDEEIVPDYRPAGNGLIIDGIHDRFVFRSGKRKATATRHALRDED